MADILLNDLKFSRLIMSTGENDSFYSLTMLLNDLKKIKLIMSNDSF
jgi:hypothetical protein